MSQQIPVSQGHRALDIELAVQNESMSHELTVLYARIGELELELVKLCSEEVVLVA